MVRKRGDGEIYKASEKEKREKRLKDKIKKVREKDRKREE